jgi:hypothetical protein
MSIASRSLSSDVRASAIAASISTRLRAISPVSARTRRLPECCGPGFAGRPNKRAGTGCFGFLVVFGFLIGIATPHRILRAIFFDKYLKNWYLLPICASGRRVPAAC